MPTLIRISQHQSRVRQNLKFLAVIFVQTCVQDIEKKTFDGIFDGL